MSLAANDETPFRLPSAIKELHWLATLGGSSMAAASKECSWGLYQELSSPCPGFASLLLHFMLAQAVLLAAHLQRVLTDSKPRGNVLLPQCSQQEPQADSAGLGSLVHLLSQESRGG